MKTCIDSMCVSSVFLKRCKGLLSDKGCGVCDVSVVK